MMMSIRVTILVCFEVPGKWLPETAPQAPRKSDGSDMSPSDPGL